MLNAKIFTILILLTCSALCTSSNNDTAPEETEQLDKYAVDLMKSMNITNEGEVTRDQFRELFTKVVLREGELKPVEREFYENIIERMVQKAPAIFPTVDLPKYMDINKMVTLIEEVTAEMTGEDKIEEDEPAETGKNYCVNII